VNKMHLNGLPRKPVNPWRCSSCGQIDPEEIQEPAYGFEGEYWGAMVRQEHVDVLISACCRASIIDNFASEKTPDDEEDRYQRTFPFGVEDYA
jgi:hypothetical protein